MLIRRPVLDRIASGDVDLQFRRWTRPTVKTGGTLRTPVGMLAIVAVTRVTMRSLTADDAHRAGYSTLRELHDHMRAKPEGHIFRIEVQPGGTDPLVDLRNQSELSSDEITDIATRLARLDAASATGPWTLDYLDLLASNPFVRAQDLADGLGLEKPVFKGNVRKLKMLGLTISHSPGYELSPRGVAYVARRHLPPTGKGD
jgi:hypothetical protein